MSRSVLIAAVAAAFVGTASLASAQTTTAAAPANAPDVTDHTNPKDEIVCKRMQVTGQLLPGPKICHTRGEWEDMQRQSQYQVEQAQQRAGAHGGG